MDRVVFPDVHSVIVLASSRLLNLEFATSHPSFVRSFMFIHEPGAEEDLRAPRQKHHLCRRRAFPVVWKCCSSQVSQVKDPAESTTNNMKCDVDIRKESYANVVLSAARPVPRDF